MAPLSCVICNKSPAKGCGTCKSSAYCSKACQTIDWPLHKALCKVFTKLPPRPATPSKLGILLAADNPDPRFIWVPCPKVVEELDEGKSIVHDNPTVEFFLGPNTYIERFLVSTNEVRGYPLERALVLHARDNSLNDGSKPNQAALALTDWKLPYDWRGNILALSKAGEGGELGPFQDYQDVSMGDLRTAVDYLNSYGMSAGHGQRECKGVLIRCEGDIGLNRNKTGKWERFSEVDVANNHAIWRERSTGPSKVMGLPLLAHKLPHNPAWNENDHTRFDNQPATFLNLTVDPKNPAWGFAPPDWQSGVGSILLVREDGKDLSREQAWALAEYMQFRVSDSFEAAMESGDMRLRRAAVLKMLNWKRFDSFLDNFKVEMLAADGKVWEDVRSPFGAKEGNCGQPL